MPDTMLKRDRSTLFYSALLLTIFIWFLMLGHRSLFNPDEGRYAEIPREMVASHDWVTPRLNDFKYFEKPALQYWATAITFELFGQSNFTARLWTALISLLGAAWTGFVAARLFNRNTGWYAFFISASSFLYFGFGHIVTLDMSVSVFMMITLGSFLIAQANRASPVQSLRWMLLAWAAAACAVLTKGLIGVVLPAGAVFLYSLWQRDWQLWRHLHIIKGCLLFLLITAPWFVVVSMRNPEFAHFFFIHEHWERYTTTIHHRDAPDYYFLPILLLGAVPWTYHGVASLVKPAFKWRPDNRGAFDPQRLLWVYTVFIVVFFSLGHSKLPAYILPVMPTLAILAAHRLTSAARLSREAVLLGLVAALLLLAAILLPRFASQSTPSEVLKACQPWLVTSAVTLLAGSIWLYRSKHNVARGVAITSVVVMLGYQFILWGAQEVAVTRSSADVAHAILSRTKQMFGTAFPTPRIPVYLIDHQAPSLSFYLKQPAIMVERKGELAMGIDLEPDKWIPDKKAFLKAWQRQKNAYAVIRNKDYDRYFDKGMAVDIIYRDPKRCVVQKVPTPE